MTAVVGWVCGTVVVGVGWWVWGREILSFSTHDVSSPCEVREHGGRATGVYGTHCEGCVLVHGSYCEYCEIWCTDHIVRMCSLDTRITLIVRRLGEL